MKENREKLGETDAKSAEEAIEEARRALNEGGLDRLNAAAEKLTKISHTMAETMYKSQQASAGSAAGAGAGAPGAGQDSGGGASGQAGRRAADKAMWWMPSSWTWTTRRSRTKTGCFATVEVVWKTECSKWGGSWREQAPPVLLCGRDRAANSRRAR